MELKKKGLFISFEDMSIYLEKIGLVVVMELFVG